MVSRSLRSVFVISIAVGEGITPSLSLHFSLISSSTSKFSSTSLAANCYIELGENMREVPKGAKVKVLPFTLTSEYYEQ